jgi:FkbM family methyltransferase
MKKIIKKIIPKQIWSAIKRIVYKPSNEYKWIKYTRETLNNRIKKEVLITKDGEFFLRSDFGFDFMIDSSNPYLKLDTFDDDKFKILLSYLVKQLPKDSIMLDIGAFAGGYSLAVSSYFPESKIYCFEPVKNSYDKLIINILRNKKEEKIFPYRYALTDKLGKVSMTNDQSTGNHIVPDNKVVAKNLENIPAITLDSFIIEHNIANIHFLKCDVEGHELSVINGAEQSILKYKPIIYLEIQKEWTSRYGYNPIDLINRMKAIGYKVYAIGDSSINEVNNVERSIGENENFLFMTN